ncbi:hypothetical protein A5740_10410 [Mycobacterium sp. GA-1841]|nr:hypothetical protein A5740_10410 [Mycobacterium sp. GA-1841]
MQLLFYMRCGLLLAVLHVLTRTATDDGLGVRAIFLVQVLILGKVGVATLFLALALTVAAAHTTHTAAHTTHTGTTRGASGSGAAAAGASRRCRDSFCADGGAEWPSGHTATAATHTSATTTGTGRLEAGFL